MYLVHMPFAFKLDENMCAAATNEDGSYILDFDTDPVSVWKVWNQFCITYYYDVKEIFERAKLFCRRWRSKLNQDALDL